MDGPKWVIVKLNDKMWVKRFLKIWKKMWIKSIDYKECCHIIEINPCLGICNGTIERRFTRGPLFTRQSGSALYVCVKWLRTGASRTWPLQSTQLSLYRATTYYWSPGKSVCTTPPPPTILLTSTVQWRVSLLEWTFFPVKLFSKGQLRNFERTF